MSLFPEDSDERGGYWIFKLRKSHPFQPAFEMHDRLYGSFSQGFHTMTRLQADRFLLRSMLIIAKEKKSKSLKSQARLYYALARVFGGLVW